MKNTPQKRAPKAHQDAGGILHVNCGLPLKKEADLAKAYYPGLLGVIRKVEAKAANQPKYDRLHKTIALISTLRDELNPVVSAKAALISEVADVNVFPLLLDADAPTEHADTMARLQRGFSAVLTAGMTRKELEILRATWKCELPVYADWELLAAAVSAAVMNAAKMQKSNLKKIRVTIEGDDDQAIAIAEQLHYDGVQDLTYLDERGPLYLKRPNMNRQKNELVSVSKPKKDGREREEVLAETDVYIFTSHEDIDDKTTSQLPAKATIISLQSETIAHGKQQSVISTLPMRPNHLSDLHLAAGLMKAVSDGKQLGKDSLEQAIKGVHAVYKAPKKDRLFPGLLDKNLAEKIAKAIK